MATTELFGAGGDGAAATVGGTLVPAAASAGAGLLSAPGRRAIAVCTACGSELVVPRPPKGGVDVVTCATCTLPLVYRSARHLSETEVLGPAGAGALVAGGGAAAAPLAALALECGPPADGVPAALHRSLPWLQMTDFSIVDETGRPVHLRHLLSQLGPPGAAQPPPKYIRACEALAAEAPEQPVPESEEDEVVVAVEVAAPKRDGSAPPRPKIKLPKARKPSHAKGAPAPKKLKLEGGLAAAVPVATSAPAAGGDAEKEGGADDESSSDDGSGSEREGEGEGEEAETCYWAQCDR